MKDLKFNINAFIAPTTRAEFISLLDEGLRMADDLDQQIDRDTSLLEAARAMTIAE
jgi:hypothetical protein